MERCRFLRTDDSCRWCELGYMVHIKNGQCTACDGQFREENDEKV